MAICQNYRLRWSDVDANGHVRHAVYAELGAEIRLGWLKDLGFDWSRFASMGFGPVLLREEVDYLKELEFGAEVTIDLEALGLSPEGGRWKLRHTLRRTSGEDAARIVVTGGWLDHVRRRLVLPPEALNTLLHAAPRAADYAELPPLRR
ncbi:MAG TPA: acyl-CoA thioesterase [Anaeromyxobacteraceae bacterium]|nr:acyl-CoA thioesterase [Anaeromyxobacteraceae bacterium]